MSAYYNENDPYAAQWLRNLIAAGHLPAGDVDERSIVDVQPDDLVRYRQCHFFAGIGGWALAARLAGWPDDREIWTGSPPCQPFSVAGKQRGHDDERHLWPELFRLLRARRPAVLMGEQVAAAVGKDWLDGVCADLEGIGYSCGAVVVPACAVNAPHRRDRLWFVGHAKREGLERLAGDGAGRCGWQESHRPVAPAGSGGDVAHGDGRGLEEREECDGSQIEPGQHAQRRLDVIGSRPCDGDVADPDNAERRAGLAGRDNDHWTPSERDESNRDVVTGCWLPWHNAGWIIGHDGKARRIGARICQLVDGFSAGMAGVRARQAAEEVEMIPLLAHGVAARVGKLRAFGNAIVPQVAAEVIGAYMEAGA